MNRNLLYIFADQWRAQSVGHMHMDNVKTPNIDHFASHSIDFYNAISTYPLCSPHRASLLTGKYPFQCGVWTNCKTGLSEIIMLKPQEITISDVLHRKGYQTAYIGKWHLDASEQNFTSSPASGCTNWDAYTPPGERRHHFDYWYSYGASDEHLHPHYFENSEKKLFHDKWSVEVETEKLFDFIDNCDPEKPFCAFLSWNPPHPPYHLIPDIYYDKLKNREIHYRDNVPLDIQEDEAFQIKIKQYFSAIEGIDEYFGKIIDYLQKNNLYENTVIVLSADHGDCLGSHRIFDKNVWYEESIRIPLYIGGSDITPHKSDALIGSQDHMPTILDYLGVDIPDTVSGRSFADIIRGNTMQEEPEEAFLCMYPGMPAMLSEFELFGLNSKAFGWRGLRTKRYTYVVNNGITPHAAQEKYLYDNLNDPYQLKPIILSKDQACEWDTLLMKYLKRTNDPFLLNKQ